MANIGSIQIDFTGNVKKLLSATDRVDKRLQKLQRDAQKTKKNIANFAKAAVGVYTLGKAFDSIILKSIDFNKQMEDSEIKLKAMIASSVGWETQAGKQVTAQERLQLINEETAYTMGLIKDINSQTAFGMQDLITSYSLMKPAMDRANVSTKDQVKLLKLVTNTASTFGLSNQELSTGIDDLASGTYRTSQSFGKMMKAIGVSREDIKTTTDLVGYLSKKMEATGKAQDSLTVAQSNFGVSFDNLRGKLTQPIFEQIKKDLKYFTHQMDTTSPESMQVFADAITDMANTGIAVVSALMLSITGLVSLMKTAFGGLQKLAGFTVGGVASSVLESKREELKELERIQKEKDYGLLSNTNYGTTRRNIIELKKEISSMVKVEEWGNSVRKEGDKLVESTTEQQKKLTDGIFKATHTLWLEKKKITAESDKSNDNEEKLKKKITKTIAETEKHTKALKAHINNLKKAKEYYDGIMLSAKDKALVELGKKLQVIDKYLGHDAAFKAYKKGLKDLEKSADSLGDKLQKILGIKNDSVFANLFSNVMGSLGSVGDSLRSGSEIDTKGLFTSLLDSVTGGIGGQIASLIGGLFSSNVSQAEIDKATGRVDFTDESLKNLGDIYSNALNPQLQATNDMNKHLRNMEQSFSVIAKGIVGSLGVKGFDLTGLNYNGSSSSGFLGFSSKTVDLLGTGLNVGGSLDSVDAYGYLTELIKKSSWWGLKTSSSIRTTSYKLPPDVQNAFSDVLNDGVSSIVTSAVALGFDSDKIKDALSTYQISTGYVSLKGLSPKDAEDRVQAMFSEIFSGAINGLDGAITNLVNKYANVGEESMQTLSRIAVEFEQATYAFSSLGKTFADEINGYTSQYKLLDIIKFSGGSQSFNDTYTNFVDKYYTDAEKLKFQTKAMRDSFANLNLEMPKNNDAMRELILSYDVTNEAQAETYANLLKLTDGFYSMSEATLNLENITSGTVNSIRDAYLGTLSYFNGTQKLDFANSTLDYAVANNLDVVGSAKAAAEQALANTATKEEYKPYFDQYIKVLESQENDATNKDIIEELRVIASKVEHLETTTLETAIHA